MTKKLVNIQGDLYSLAEEYYFDAGMDQGAAVIKLVKTIQEDLQIGLENSKKLGSAIMEQVVKKFN